MSKPQPSISVPFVNEWRIRRPSLYRYLEKQYVDSFFETGLIRLSSFDAFANHTDEPRLDPSEGKGIIEHINTEGEGQTMMAAARKGHNSYVLCASSLYSSELAEDFETDSGFRIDDIFGFVNAIGRYIPGFVGGIEGPCLYLQKRVLERDMGKVDLDSMRVSPGSKNIDMGKMMQAVFGMAGDDLFFIKHIRFAHQNEYRILWHVSGDVSHHKDIRCPEAIQFCTHFERLGVENGR